MHVLTILYTQGGGGHKAQRGLVARMQGAWYPGCSTQLCSVSSRHESGGGPHMQGRHTRSLWTGLRKLVVLTLNIHQIFK